MIYSLQRFEKTNEMLSNCNTLSVSRLKVAGQQFKNYKQLLTDIKKDLDYTFKKINVLKNKIQSHYPEGIDGNFKCLYCFQTKYFIIISSQNLK